MEENKLSLNVAEGGQAVCSDGCDEKRCTPAVIDRSGGLKRGDMLDVLIALAPSLIAAVLIFGIRALWTALVCVASAVLSEYLFNLFAHKTQTVSDLSAIVTGLLLALGLNVTVPLWQCAIGAAFAIIVVKCLFGGLGKNIVNPAATAHVFMLLSFPAVRAVALPCGAAAWGFSLPSLLLGLHGDTVSATCALALTVGFVYLVLRRVIEWYVPAAFLATAFVCSFLFGGFDPAFALRYVLTGGVLLAAVFMATDRVTTPLSGKGRVIFAAGASALAFFIQRFGVYGEGTFIAILTMNLITPFINDLAPKKRAGGDR